RRRRGDCGREEGAHDVSPGPGFFSCSAPAPPAIYTLSLHDALPIWNRDDIAAIERRRRVGDSPEGSGLEIRRVVLFFVVLFEESDRKSTRLNSSHVKISYAAFRLKKNSRLDGGIGPDGRRGGPAMHG